MLSSKTTFHINLIESEEDMQNFLSSNICEFTLPYNLHQLARYYPYTLVTQINQTCQDVLKSKAVESIVMSSILTSETPIADTSNPIIGVTRVCNIYFYVIESETLCTRKNTVYKVGQV